SVPMGNVTAIYAKENGAGMAFEPEAEGGAAAAPDVEPAGSMPLTDDEPEPPPAPPAGRPKLQRIK
ncbi:MAG: ClpXP protease specificity-enhancing factor SspB, partial [Propionivibrio sp.]